VLGESAPGKTNPGAPIFSQLQHDGAALLHLTISLIFSADASADCLIGYAMRGCTAAAQHLSRERKCRDSRIAGAARSG
jgi:hypothetical protein